MPKFTVKGRIRRYEHATLTVDAHGHDDACRRMALAIREDPSILEMGQQQGSVFIEAICEGEHDEATDGRRIAVPKHWSEAGRNRGAR